MSRQAQSIHWDSYELDRIHREKRIQKLEKIRMYRALLEEWESFENADHAYILQLRAKLRSAENQLAAMSI